MEQMTRDTATSMYVTVNDYDRIMRLIETTSLKYKNPDMTDLLMKELKSAKMVSQQAMPDNVVTMNSRVLLKDLRSGRETEVTIAYPDDADPRLGKISVLSPVGIALIGCRVDDIASWRVPGGIGRFRIAKIMYQPEAAGHYHL